MIRLNAPDNDMFSTIALEVANLGLICAFANLSGAETEYDLYAGYGDNTYTPEGDTGLERKT